jgi:DNA polymerase
MQDNLFSDEMTRGPGGRAALKSLETRARVCQRCALHEGRKLAVIGEGCIDRPPVAFIGEGPGAKEDESGRPFVGPAGQLLDKQIAAMGFTREQVFVCNVVCCRPPGNRKPEKSETKACNQFLLAQLRVVQPRIIVAMGTTAAQTLVNSEKGIGALRGRWHEWQDKAKNSPVPGLTIPVRATYHPAYLLRETSKKGEVWKDLQIVLQWLNRKERE